MSQDSQLQQVVFVEFTWEPSMIAAHIGITSREKNCHPHRLLRELRAEADGQVGQDVRVAARGIEVRLSSDVKRGDGEFAVAAVNCLSWDVSVPRGGVKVEKGWVAPGSQVASDHQREAVEENICTPVDIRGMCNETRVSTRVSAADPDNGINHALHRSWFLGPDKVRAAAEGGTVCLAGAIRSPHDREVLVATVWAAPDAAAALNDIAIL